MMHVVTLTVAVLCFPLLTLCAPLFVLSAPNLLRVGSPASVFVEAQDHSGQNLNVRITVKNHPKKNLEILSKSVTLTAENHFQILTDIKIPDDQNFFSEDPLEKQYVYLQAEFPSKTLEKVVMVSFQSGYIFVQSDKPIYTPGSRVNYRIFALTPDQRPFDGVSVSVDVVNPQGITLSRNKLQPRRGIVTDNLALPEVVSFGLWKLIAKFSNTPQKNFTAEFEVLEYTLPSFEVTLNPSKPFFYVNERSLKVEISAKYLFGNKVRGSAFVVFGVIDNERKISIAASLQRVHIYDGEGEAELTSQMIRENFPEIQQLVGKSLYISVSVLIETGSEMVDAERRGIQIVTSPYTIHFKRTPQFFKPGMSFDVSVYVTNPDQTPAKHVEVEVNPGGVKGQTRANGIAKVTINTLGGSSKLEITAKTKDPLLSNEQQATKKMTAQAYQPKGQNNYLHIGIDAAELQIGDSMKVNLNLGNGAGVVNQDFTYMILSKGQIIQAGRFKRQGQVLVTLSLPVTKEMVPSFRFVAYYHVGSSEVVSDSVWVDVKDTCMGTLKVEVKDQEQFGPGEQLSLRVTGDPGAKVGLVAVDKGVYVLNDKHILTQSKIWDVVEKHDTGCTAGSGKDSMGVFTDAGLMFESNTAGGTNTRTDKECPAPSKRKRRDTSLLQVTTTLGGQYTDHKLKACCVDGMKENNLGYSCERRVTYVLDGEDCAQAFLHCCREVKKHKNRFSAQEEGILSRSEEDEFEEELEDVMVRTQFPESWLWEEIVLPTCPPNEPCTQTSALRTGIFLKDSITTWQITAISLSSTFGMCVANPYEIVVKKDFFIDLRMPFSVVRNEQVEIKAILHNYSNQRLKAYIKFKTSEGICSSASKKQKGRIRVSVDFMSSRAVPLIIIPMDLNEQWIEVEAYSSNRNDAIKKSLKVVSEGVLTEVQERVVEINPSEHPDGTQIISMRSDIPRRKVPNTPASTLITVIGEEITRTVEQAISGDFMGRLIVQPHGCGEQNMIYMTLPVIATHYLDNTNQWEAVGIDRRNEAINYIKTGFDTQLTFRKPDGSYAVWKHTPSSTWLTAYVAKVFAMASDLIAIEEDVICSSLRWLATNKQQADGRFKEDAPVYHSEMVGDVQGKDADASLTAFVLIAMQEGSKICAGSVRSSIDKAVGYLTLRVHSLTSPYAVAITSYALAHAGKLNKDILRGHSTESKDGMFWQVPGQHYHSLEATGYAVLALVMAKDFESAGKAVRWLGKQQTHYGGYGTTQATIIVFQAVSEYRIQVKKVDINLNLELAVEERSETKKITIAQSNLRVARSDKFDITKSFSIKAQGTGVAMLSVFSVYYALPEEKDNDCSAFDLSVQMKKEIAVAYDGASESYELTIEYIFKDPRRVSTMSILDISLLTGFKVDERDLSRLSSGKDKYIQNFELNKELSERGSLIIYVDQVSNKERERIVFRVHKINEVGMLQPAGVTVYEYNAPDKRCVKYYHPHKKDGALNRLCTGELCQCAEENCSLQRTEHIDEEKRDEKACESTVEYVYKTRVVEMGFSQHADIYNMTVEKMLKEGTDPNPEGNMRSFLAHPNCREFLKFEKDKTYLIMGQTKTLPKIGGKLRYHLGEDTWIEYWPTEREGQMPQYRAIYIGITSLENKLTKVGCST